MATTTILDNFYGINGQSPTGNLTADTNGGLFGMVTAPFEISALSRPTGTGRAFR